MDTNRRYYSISTASPSNRGIFRNIKVIDLIGIATLVSYLLAIFGLGIVFTVVSDPNDNVISNMLSWSNKFMIGNTSNDANKDYITYELLDKKGNPDRSLLWSEPVRTDIWKPFPVESPLPTEVEQPKPKVLRDDTPKKQKNSTINLEDRDLLYLVVLHEAGNQDIDGCRLVCDVILNRLASPKFPNTIREVIYQKGQFMTVDAIESYLRKIGGTDSIPDKVRDAVDMELNTGLRYDSASLYFARKPVTSVGVYQHGDHYFSR